MTSQAGEQIITINILPNISRRNFFKNLKKKFHIKWKQVVGFLVLIYFGRPRLGHTSKTNYNISGGWFKAVLNFLFFFVKRSGTSFSTTTYYQEKYFFMLYPIYWPNFTFWLPLLLEILGNICVVIIFCSVFDVINFEINLSFLIKPFS